MPLSYGQKYALYILLAKHSNHPSGKSAFRQLVENQVAAGNTDQQALRLAAQNFDPNIDTSAIGPLTNLEDDNSLRAALAMPYTGGSCPGLAASTAIYNAIKGIQDPT
jgi:hypothetical protein